MRPKTLILTDKRLRSSETLMPANKDPNPDGLAVTKKPRTPVSM
jgi:hypothetical protein